jgi:hypothetical protein
VEKNKTNYPRLAIDMHNYFKKNLRVKIKSTIISNNVSFLEKYNYKTCSPCPMSHSGTEMNRVRGQRSEAARTRLVGIILQIS